jgi:hypothetical protein
MKTLLTVIIVALTLLFVTRECSRVTPPPPAPDTIHIINRVYDTVIITNMLPKPYPVNVIVVDSIPAIVDTLSILKDYFAKNIYNRVLMDDSLALITLVDTVHQNQLWGSQVQYQNRQPVTIHETYIIHPPPPQKRQLYAGAFAQGNSNYFGAGPSIILTTPNRYLYQISYDPFNKIAIFGIAYSINLK